MNLSRRGLFGGLAAVLGGALLAKVKPKPKAPPTFRGVPVTLIDGLDSESIYRASSRYEKFGLGRFDGDAEVGGTYAVNPRGVRREFALRDGEFVILG